MHHPFWKTRNIRCSTRFIDWDLAGVIGDLLWTACALMHRHTSINPLMIKSHHNDALQLKTRTWCFEFFRELHIYPAVEHYILEALGASSHFQTCFGHTIMERVVWMIIVAFGDLTIVVDICIKGLRILCLIIYSILGCLHWKLMLEPQCSVLIRYKYNNSYFSLSKWYFWESLKSS